MTRRVEQVKAHVVGLRVTERRERSFWGGARDIVEEETPTYRQVWDGSAYRPGKIMRRTVLDARTGRLISYEEYFRGAGDRKWQRQRWVEKVEYDVEIPDDLRRFDPPPGTKLMRYRWWRDRIRKTIAVGSTPVAKVILHVIDVNRRGDVTLTLELEGRPTQQVRRFEWPRVDAFDDAGSGYRADSGYGTGRAASGSAGGPPGRACLTVTLIRKSRIGRPNSLTFTYYPCPVGPTADQSVTFSNLPLPPRQNVADVEKASVEVIQY